jgi:hypothetical protein
MRYMICEVLTAVKMQTVVSWAVIYKTTRCHDPEDHGRQ